MTFVDEKILSGKELEYRNYIIQHKKNVELSWDILKKDINDDCLYFTIDALIQIHDNSKFSTEEFGKYRQFFFPNEGDEKSKTSFAFGWNHHQKSNPHHWQYWVMYKGGDHVEALKMPFEYIIEMVCDWMAMSIKFNTSLADWFYDNLDQMLFHEDTFRMLEPMVISADAKLESWKVGMTDEELEGK